MRLRISGFRGLGLGLGGLHKINKIMFIGGVGVRNDLRASCIW